MLTLSEKEKTRMHYYFLLCLENFCGNNIPSKIISKGLNGNISKEELIRHIGMKNYVLYFLAHEEKMFYRHLRNIFHQLKGKSSKETIQLHIDSAKRYLGLINGNSELFRQGIEYVKERLSRCQT